MTKRGRLALQSAHFQMRYKYDRCNRHVKLMRAGHVPQNEVRISIQDTQ